MGKSQRVVENSRNGRNLGAKSPMMITVQALMMMILFMTSLHAVGESDALE